MKLSDFYFELPADRIAQVPPETRGASRLLVLDRRTRLREHRLFRDFRECLRPGDVLVVNDSRVIPARLRGVKQDTAGEFEILLLEESQTNRWWVLLRPGKRVRPGTQLLFRNRCGTLSSVSAEVLGKNSEGHCQLQFRGTANILDELGKLGEIPLPPYITRLDGETDDDRIRYQTVFANASGSVAAPTAGLHFTTELLDQLQADGIEIRPVTLHVGLGTFSPVKVEDLACHVMHSERYSIPAETATAINHARSQGRRIIAIGTTSCRVLESAARNLNESHTTLSSIQEARTQIFIRPPAEFCIVNAMLTNFHLPESTLLMLVAAFAAPGKVEGRELILDVYADAIREKYRFFSYGDAMFIH